VIALVFAVFTVIYRFVVNRNFGGVTGDTAGFYIVTSEVYAITALAVTAILTLG
jgi:adenosylcobinamide-GDP ribazoletransferase